MNKSLAVWVSSVLIVTLCGSAETRAFNAAVSYAPTRGAAGDLWADVIIGQPDFSEMAPNTVVPNKLCLPYGVIIDRQKTTSANFQKLYIHDSGNNRILGFNWDSMLASSSNPINASASIVLGQPSFYTSAANGDSGFQSYPQYSQASAYTLRSMPEWALSPGEGIAVSSMAMDSQGNLYACDIFNHRVLKYTKPFESGLTANIAAVDVIREAG